MTGEEKTIDINFYAHDAVHILRSNGTEDHANGVAGLIALSEAQASRIRDLEEENVAAVKLTRLSKALLDDANAELTLLREEIGKAREALEPFAAEAADWNEMWTDDRRPWMDPSGLCAECEADMDASRAFFTVGDLRRAAAVCEALARTHSEITGKETR